MAVFANHSCALNGKYVEHNDEDTSDAFLFLEAFRSIYKGEEITVDHQPKMMRKKQKSNKCLSDAPPEICRGCLG